MGFKLRNTFFNFKDSLIVELFKKLIWKLSKMTKKRQKTKMSFKKMKNKFKLMIISNQTMNLMIIFNNNIERI